MHAVGGLVVADRRLDLRVVVDLAEEVLIDVVDEREALALQPVRLFGAYVRQRLVAVGVNERALMDGRQVTVAKDVDAAQRDPAAANDDKARQVAVLGPQPVRHPRAQRREAGEGLSAVVIEVRLGVLHELDGHRADDGQAVGLPADVREQVADRNAAFTVMVELPRAGEDVAVLVEHRPLGGERHRLAGFFGQARLGVERVDLGDAAGHIAKDDVLDLGRMMRKLRGERVGGFRFGRAGVGVVGHQGG